MSKPKKILIIRFSSIGDIVLTSPVLRCLKQQLGATIHFLTKASFGFILEANPYVDRVFTLAKEGKKDNWSALIPMLKAENYDVVIDLHKNLHKELLRIFLIY